MNAEELAVLIEEIANEAHQYGLIRDHADPNDKGWSVNDIKTCAYTLCVEALTTSAALRSNQLQVIERDRLARALHVATGDPAYRWFELPDGSKRLLLTRADAIIRALDSTTGDAG